LNSLLISKVPLPEAPDTEDEAEVRKWKWKVKNVKKENNERHSQRCDIELKLAVRNLLLLERLSYIANAFQEMLHIFIIVHYIVFFGCRLHER